MKLSMWTLCDYLIKTGFDVVPYISEGLPCISLIRQSSGRTYSSGYAEVFSDGRDVHVVNDMDRLTVKNAELSEVTNCLGLALDKYNQWEHELYECIIHKGSLQEMLDIAKKVFGRPMFIKNDATRTLAITHGYSTDVHPYWDIMESSEDVTPDSEIVSAVSSDPEYKLAFTDKYPSVRSSPAYGAMVLHANIFVNNVRTAEVVTLENGIPFNNGDIHLMNTFTELIGKYVNSDPHIFRTASEAMVTFKTLIESGDTDSEQIDSLKHYLNLKDENEMCVAVVSATDRLDSPVLSALREKLEAGLNDAAVIQIGNHVAILFNICEKEYQGILTELRHCIPKEGFCWSLSYEFSDVKAAGLYYRQGMELLDKLFSMEGTNHITAYEAAYVIITDMCEKDEVNRTYIHPDLLRLERSDIQDHTDYCETLFYYLLCGGNFTDAAKIMDLHRNTLIYRINKIRDIMRSSLDDIQNRKSLIYSYLLLNKDY